MAKVIIEADTSLPEDLKSLQRFFGAASAELTKVVGAVSIKAKAANPEELKEVLGGTPTDETAAEQLEKPVTEQVLDSKGVPWDERIHASTKTTTKDGRWKKLRGVSEERRDEIEDEIRLGYEEKTIESTDETPTKEEPKKEQPKTDTEDTPDLNSMELSEVLSYIDLQVEKDPESKSIHTNLLTALKKLMAINSKLRDPAMKFINTFKKENGNLCVSPRDLQPCDVPTVTEWIRTKGTQGDE